MLFPAANPVAKAICILKPPVKASTSSTSPQKRSPLCFLLSIVLGLISESSMPPEVMIASSKPRRLRIFKGKAFSVFTRRARSSFVNTLTLFDEEIDAAERTQEISFCGKSSHKALQICLFFYFSKSRSRRLSKVASSKAGLKSNITDSFSNG